MPETASPSSIPLDFDALFAAEIDVLAVAASRQLSRLDVPLAHAAAAVSKARAWTRTCYARQSDFAREHLDRSSHWLSDRACLGRALRAAPALAEALDGASRRGDGGGGDGSSGSECRRIGIVAAIEIAHLVANGLSPRDVEMWIDRARRVPVEQLRAEARAYRRELRRGASGDGPLVHDDAPGPRADVDSVGGTDAYCARWAVGIYVPPAVRAAFSEALELFRRVSGGQATVTEFAEALVAEWSASASSYEAPSGEGVDAALVEGVLRRPGARSAARAEPNAAPDDDARDDDARDDDARGDDARDDDARDDADWDALVAAFGDPVDGEFSLTRRLSPLVALVDSVIARPQPASRDEALERLENLVRLESVLRRVLGELLDRLRRSRPFRRGGSGVLPYADLRHYALERLGIGVGTAERLARLARGTKRYEMLREAYAHGHAAEGATLRILRLLDRSESAREAEDEWTSAAESLTQRRIDDEMRAFEARDALGDDGEDDAAPFEAAAPRRRGPMPDREWLASLARRPGETAARLRCLAAHAVAHHALHRQRSMRIVLPVQTALDFEDALDRARSSRLCSSFFSDPSHPPDTEGTPPRWAGLLTLLLHAAHEWDGQAEASTPREWRPRVYARDGYRCAAPGCTSRSNLEEHHIVYRSRGGSDECVNRVTLCRFHHQLGEHGELMRVRGEAPHGLEWRLGPQGGAALWFVADRRVFPRMDS